MIPYKILYFMSCIKYGRKIIFNLLFTCLKHSKVKTLVCFDSSKSMNGIIDRISSLDIAKSMAIYYSRSLKGPFKKSFLTFNSGLHHWSNAYDLFYNTELNKDNDINILNLVYRLSELKNEGYKESDFPKRILCITNGKFNFEYAYVKNGKLNKTASDDIINNGIKNFYESLLKAGFSKEYVDNLELIVWDVPNNAHCGGWQCFLGSLEIPNYSYLNKFDPCGIKYLL